MDERGHGVMKLRTRKIGIALETKEDAASVGAPLEDLYHWREPEEIEAIVGAVESLGFRAVLLGPPAAIVRGLPASARGIDFILNLSVGFQTRHRLAAGPALCELLGLPYSGADPYTKLVSQNKHLMKSIWDKLGIPTPAWTFVPLGFDPAALDYPDFPLIVKPACEGSSIGLGPDAVVGGRAELCRRVRAIHERLRLPAVAESFVAGREIKVGVVGDADPVFVGCLEDVTGEGLPLGDEFLFFNAKTVGVFDKRTVDAGSPEMRGLIADALRIYRLFLPVDFGTFDVRMDGAGRHYFLEFNADATLHPKRTLAQCAALQGMDFPRLIEAILKVSFARWGMAWN